MNLISNETLQPFDFILFGGTGDLSIRKLIPSLYFRHCEGQLPEDSRIIATARSDMDTAGFRSMLNTDVREHIDDNDFNADSWKEFLDLVYYHPLDVTDPESYRPLVDTLAGREEYVRVFYLSVAPSLFTQITNGVHAAGLITEKSRVALEKPLGRDRASAEEINDRLSAVFNEDQIYRIDHYLGKETVQNLLALRFGNAFFEPLWRSERINDVQITIAEDLGVEGRGAFYDQTGALRDMVQNHLLQLLVILAMEPPVSIDPDAVRDEKIKVLRALKPLAGIDAIENSVRGQYKAGAYGTGPVPGYLDNDDIPNDSSTETFVAIRAEIGSWRWEGVPFFLRTGKRMESKTTEIVINFKKVPHSIFPTADGFSTPNQLIIRLQPEESIRMRIYVKAWGDDIQLQPVYLNLDFNDVFQKRKMIAYERLLMDVIRGNQTLFMRRDEVAAAWAWIDPIRAAWEQYQYLPKSYTAGTWGPGASNALISKDGLRWNED
ncbi:glucose-6-phosphate dehydrogenase [Granulosicoccus antarcticus]|uniref:Glucose-6-phosphate 1-dehydrogenase n=1 Tax=Granulosicoccus antarcticus IMCC3135 TaxID=1192854 RepID=A0A2Z2NNH1_9GAMM|nr:glucose-6-phosphate dehydrogenase [Granulosicoccus antarcticus]ASJ72956.1 Glucose-6-phosphate 1-dehydrogenase [Granulosicoccus antarcticus IMCC3135]